MHDYSFAGQSVCIPEIPTTVRNNDDDDDDGKDSSQCTYNTVYTQLLLQQKNGIIYVTPYEGHPHIMYLCICMCTSHLSIRPMSIPLIERGYYHFPTLVAIA